MSLEAELAYQAEANTNEDPEAKNKAWLLCGEEQANLKKNIEELRNIIYERDECCPPRLDDAFLLRFLRARRSIPARAHRLMVRYCNFREQNPHLWRDVDCYGLARLGNIFEGVLYDRPDVGRLIIFRLGNWDPDEVSPDDLTRSMLLLLEVGIRQPKLQILGGTAMVDCEGLTMRQMKNLTPTFAMHIMNVLGFGFPIYQRGIHIINCSKVFEMMFRLFKRVAPADDVWKRVYFHGYNLSSLHRYIDPECLPKQYGGVRRLVSFGEWLLKVRHYAGNALDEDLKTLGYAVD